MVSGRETAASGLMLLSCLLLLAGVALLCLTLVKLAVPTLFADTAFLSYGRLRPATASLLAYGFGGTFAQAAAYYLTPRLVGTRMDNQPLALLAGCCYALLVLAGTLVVLFRGPSGPEMAEFPPLLDWPIAVLLLVPGPPRHFDDQGSYRRGFPTCPLLYVIGAVWWFPALHITASIPGLAGLGPFLQKSVTSGGMWTLAFPAAALGGAYYILVKESGQPLFSGPLARAGFWTLAGVALLATARTLPERPGPRLDGDGLGGCLHGPGSFRLDLRSHRQPDPLGRVGDGPGEFRHPSPDSRHSRLHHPHGADRRFRIPFRGCGGGPHHLARRTGYGAVADGSTGASDGFRLLRPSPGRPDGNSRIHTRWPEVSGSLSGAEALRQRH